MRRLLEKILKGLRRNKRDDEVPQNRADNDPSLKPSARITSTNLTTAPPLQVQPLNDQSSSTTPTQNDPDNKTQKITDKGADIQKKNYWQLAIDKLKFDDPSFLDTISFLQEAAKKDGRDFTEQQLKSTDKALDTLLKKQWVVQIGGKPTVVRDQLGKIVTAIDSFKDVGNVASSFDRTFAGLPWAGFCVLLHLATSDSEQYMAMVAGAQEIATVILRYKHIEELYISRPETNVTEEFAARLISLYMNIIKYQTAVTCYYGHSTILRFLRPIPKLDDVSDIIKAIRQEDAECKDVTQVFQFQEPHSISLNAPWIVPRPVNALFMGRQEILQQIEEAIQRSLGESDRCEPCRIVITGMGGQGKSEICLQIANRLRSLFQGVFWIDVSTDALAEAGFMNIAEAIHSDARNLEEARQALFNFRKPWLLVLDNADDPSIDYQVYLPTGTYGVVLMTSRNSNCSKYATVLHSEMTLEGLDDDSARGLLLKAANLSPDECVLYERNAEVICDWLISHPLALIQAGSYVARGHCKLHQYLQKFRRHLEQVMEYNDEDIGYYYMHVYATFEAYAEVLKLCSDRAARDALEILSMFSTIGYSQLPLAIFEAAWQGVRKMLKYPSEWKYVDGVSLSDSSPLISLIDVDADEWDQDRLIEAINCLTSFSFITAHEKNGFISSISMHPLTHAWVKQRATSGTEHLAWISTGYMFAISASTGTLWMKYERQLKPHLQAFLDDSYFVLDSDISFNEVGPIVLTCARLMTHMVEDSKLLSLLERFCYKMQCHKDEVFNLREGVCQLYRTNFCEREKTKDVTQLMEEAVKTYPKAPILNIKYPAASRNELAAAFLVNGKPYEAKSVLRKVRMIDEECLDPEDPYRLARQHLLAIAYRDNGEPKEAISLLEDVVNIRERTLSPEHAYRLSSQHDLVRAYIANRQTTKATSLLEKVCKIGKECLDPEDPYRLAGQHMLAIAYLAKGQTKEAISLLEEVVKIGERTLAPDHMNRLSSQHDLARAYIANWQTTEAISVLEKVCKIGKECLDPENPYRLARQHLLAITYLANGQTKEAISLLEEVVKIREINLFPDHMDRLSSQYDLARAYIANWQTTEAKSLFEKLYKASSQCQFDPYPYRVAGQHLLAMTYLDDRQATEAVQAEPLLEEVVNIRERTLAPMNLDIRTPEHDLARVYIANWQTTAAISFLEKVCKMGKECLDSEDPYQLARQHLLALKYLANGQTKEAISLLEEVVNIRERTLAPGHMNRLSSQYDLARAYIADCQTPEAISFLEKVCKIGKECLDPKDPYRLARQHLLAITYLANGQTNEAISLLEEVVNIRERTLAPGHMNRLSSQYDLARAYIANWQSLEAISFLEKVCKIDKEWLDPKDPYRLARQHLLAVTYLANGQTKEAISLLEEVAEIRERILAPGHMNRLSSQYDLARVYIANWQTTGAISVLEKVCKIGKEWLDPKDPYRLAGQHLLAITYLANGQATEAVPLLEEVVKIRERILAPQNLNPLSSQYDLARAYIANWQTTEAISVLEKVCKIGKECLDPEDPCRLAGQHLLAITYLANGQPKEAISLLEAVVKIGERTLAPGHMNRLSPQHDLARAYIANWQTTEAISVLEKVCKIGKECLDPEDPYRLIGQHLLAIAYLDNGQTKEAILLLEEVVEIRVRTLAPENLNRLSSQDDLARAYIANWQTTEAISLLVKVCEIGKEWLDPKEPYRLIGQHLLAIAYLDNGQTKEAISLLEEVVDIRERTLIPEHPYRLSSQHDLARAYIANWQTKKAISLLKEIAKNEKKTQDPQHLNGVALQQLLAKAYQENAQTSGTPTNSESSQG